MSTPAFKWNKYLATVNTRDLAVLLLEFDPSYTETIKFIHTNCDELIHKGTFEGCVPSKLKKLSLKVCKLSIDSPIAAATSLTLLTLQKCTVDCTMSILLRAVALLTNLVRLDLDTHT
ncbi:unnamed protein product [Peniophora sp. CBMAI 1063]|nr:unnamed protein product [Peniophora sp. CBMAI 1063]